MKGLVLPASGLLLMMAGAAYLLQPAPSAPQAAQPPAAPGALALPPAAVPAPAGPPGVPRPALAPPSPPSTSAPSAAIGSEGYGPHIERAAAGNSPAADWEAVKWLRACAANSRMRDSLTSLRDRGLEPQLMAEMLREADAESRRCQTVTEAHRRLLPSLAARAMRGQVAEAAAAYSNAVFPGDLTASERQEVADSMRRDALTGDAARLRAALQSHPAWGLTDQERMVYAAALQQLPDRAADAQWARSMTAQGLLPAVPPNQPALQAAVQKAAAEIATRARAAPGG